MNEAGTKKKKTGGGGVDEGVSRAEDFEVLEREGRCGWDMNSQIDSNLNKC